MYSGVAPNCYGLAHSACSIAHTYESSKLPINPSIIVALTTGTFEVFVMYFNSLRSLSTVQVKYFVTMANYGVITHLVKLALKGNRKGPR